MPALTAADLTVVVTETKILGQKRRNRGTLTFGDGAKTYPTAGIPLPAISAFGFVRSMDTFDIVGLNERTSEYLLRYGPANRTLLMYVSHDTAGVTTLPMDEDNTEAPAARTYTWVAEGW